MGFRSYSYLSCSFLCPTKCSLFLFNATNILSMILGVLCYSYLSCGKFCIQTRVNTGPQSPQLLHCMFTTVMEVSIKTGCKNTQVANYNHGLVALVIWAADCQVGGHWSGHSSTNKRGCITGFIITMAWLKLNDWKTVEAIFRSHSFKPLPVKHSKMSEFSVEELYTWW